MRTLETSIDVAVKASSISFGNNSSASLPEVSISIEPILIAFCGIEEPRTSFWRTKLPVMVLSASELKSCGQIFSVKFSIAIILSLSLTNNSDKHCTVVSTPARISAGTKEISLNFSKRTAHIDPESLKIQIVF